MAMTFAFLKSSAPVIRAPHKHLQVEQLGSQYRDVMEQVVWIGSSFKFQPFDGFQGFLELANHHLAGSHCSVFQDVFWGLTVVVQEEMEMIPLMMQDFFFCGEGLAVRNLQATSTRPDGASGGRDVTRIESSSLPRVILKSSLIHAGNRSRRPSIYFGYSTFEKRKKTEEEVKKKMITQGPTAPAKIITRPTMRSMP